jgi:type IV pilus assembly protein PilA
LASAWDDLFAKLSGEIGFDVENLTPSAPQWRVLFKTNDPSALLATLRKLYLSMRMVPVETEEGGVAYHTITVPTPQKPMEISYAVVDNYLVLGSGKLAVMDAVHVHRSGESLAKSRELMSALPPGSSLTASALTYQDQTAWTAFNLRRIAPSLADSITPPSGETHYAASVVYADDTNIRTVSQSATLDATAVMIGAAIAIPNLLRARSAANESSAVATVRTVNTAQVTYAAIYPTNGFARRFASLGQAPFGAPSSAQYAGLIDLTAGGMTCPAGLSCVKSGYRFTLSTNCKPTLKCGDYAVTATPQNNSTGTRSFCSTADAVLRFKADAAGAPLSGPTECRTWAPVR